VIEDLIRDEDWKAARKAIRRELTEDPENHWLLTQLGVTYYEERKYRESLKPLLAAFDLVPDCPLTLWNLAGTVDALGKPKIAILIYAWILRSNTTAADDSCWEDEEWTSALRTDCVYRVGMCFKHMKRWEPAEHCFRQYVNLLLSGMNGMYPITDAAEQIREVHSKSKNGVEKNVRDALDSTLRDLQKAGIEPTKAGRRKLPEGIKELLAT
jgi:tetratricopeptide (TPR) repeat protein